MGERQKPEGNIRHPVPTTKFKNIQSLKLMYNLNASHKAKGCSRYNFLTFFLCLRCPETLFISHENANFLFSVFKVVQGEVKTPKIMGYCRANFAFLHALKIGTFRGK